MFANSSAPYCCKLKNTNRSNNALIDSLDSSLIFMKALIIFKLHLFQTMIVRASDLRECARSFQTNHEVLYDCYYTKAWFISTNNNGCYLDNYLIFFLYRLSLKVNTCWDILAKYSWIVSPITTLLTYQTSLCPSSHSPINISIPNCWHHYLLSLTTITKLR